MQVQESAEGTEQMHLKHLSYVLGVYTMGGQGEGEGVHPYNRFCQTVLGVVQNLPLPRLEVS